MKYFAVLGLLLALYAIVGTMDFSVCTRHQIVCQDGRTMFVGPELAKMSNKYICEEE